MEELSEMQLKKIIKGGATSKVEFKIAVPKAVGLAERFCGMANAQDGMVIFGMKDSDHEIVGIVDERLGETVDVILRASCRVLKVNRKGPSQE